MAHFCHFGLVTFFWLGQKTKSDFFHKIITSYLLSNPFLWPEKLAAIITQTYFGRFCYCVPPWKILKHGFFEPLGGPLWPCDSLLLWTGLFIQIHSETLCPVIVLTRYSLKSLSRWYFDPILGPRHTQKTIFASMNHHFIDKLSLFLTQVSYGTSEGN